MPEKETVRVAFLGNSIQYYNDLPRFMGAFSNNVICQDSCFRGNANLTSLFKEGNGMSAKFKTTNSLQPDGTYDIGAANIKSLLQRDWDYIVINDHTQHPTRPDTKLESTKSLVQDYAPLIRQSGGTPVFLMTFAYGEQGIYGSEDLGDVELFTNLLREGYEYYVKAMSKILPFTSAPRIAPAGLAFYTIHQDNPNMWGKLYHLDKKHPSPHGSFLIGCVLYCTIFGVPQAKDINIPENGPASFWEEARARVMQPAGDIPQPMPTSAEARYLLDIAIKVCLSFELSH